MFKLTDFKVRDRIELRSHEGEQHDAHVLCELAHRWQGINPQHIAQIRAIMGGVEARSALATDWIDEINQRQADELARLHRQ